MKENNSLEKELNEMKVKYLSDTDFKTLVIRVLKEFNKNFNNDIVTYKRTSKA